MEKQVTKRRKFYRVDKPWSKMTTVEKRKTLAQDVILHVLNGAIKPTQGSYCDINDTKVNTDNLQEDLKKKGACDVCAMGGLMVASIIKTNRFYGIWDEDIIERRLRGTYSRGHLRLIETAFEGWVVGGHEFLEDDGGYNLPITKQAIRFKKDSAKNRLIAIMENIIADPKGKFLGNKF